MLSVRFWGVRGSIPCPGPDTVYYGGNTSCLEIRADDRLFIIDLGTGVRALGEWLLKNDRKKHGKIDADIFLTHTHWDHLMGFPMFPPVYVDGTVLRITGPVIEENNNLKKIFENQLSFCYWPVSLDGLSAKIKFKQINETTLDLGGGLTVASKYLNHPIPCLGYRFNYQGKSIATIYDHEPYRDPENKKLKKGELSAEEKNEKITQFVKDADIIVHDAQYSAAEYMSRLGWGHTSYEHAIDIAVKANVKKLVFFHHDPEHSDKQLDQLEKQYAGKTPVKLAIAREGLKLKA
ncbi:MAG: MBL fold metallo-hydrolase [Treponema sp.]|jgi:phosphoribosyl 1,2-cyclic phosphodiesterase|nr:MBL fold metallo-hydrolase [Treponema sp.]